LLILLGVTIQRGHGILLLCLHLVNYAVSGTFFLKFFTDGESTIFWTLFFFSGGLLGLSKHLRHLMFGP